MKKIYEDFLDDAQSEDAVMNDLSSDYEDDQTELICIRFGPFNTPGKFRRAIDFFIRFGNDCPFVEHPYVCAYSMEDVPGRMRFERYDITTHQQKRDFLEHYENIWKDRPNGSVRLEFVQKKVSLKVFALWMKKLGHFIQRVCMGETLYIEDFDSENIFRWKVGTESFFETSLIIQIYQSLFPDAVIDNETASQTVIDAFSGMHQANGYPYMTQLCYIRKYPDMFSGYKIETFGIYNSLIPGSQDLHMLTLLQVRKDSGTMTVDESIDFWREHFVRKLTADDLNMIKYNAGLFDVIVICDDKTIKKTDGKSDGVLVIPAGDKEIRIIAVDRNLVPLNPEYHTDDNEFGSVLSNRQFSLAKREFDSQYQRWRLCVIS